MVCAKVPEILAAMTKSCMSPTEIAKACGTTASKAPVKREHAEGQHGNWRTGSDRQGICAKIATKV